MSSGINLFGGSGKTILNVTSGMVEEHPTVTAGQTVFNLATFTYTPSTNSIWVFKNRDKLISGVDFVESSTSSFTLIAPALVTDVIEIMGFPLQAVSVVDNTVYHTFPFFNAMGVQSNIPLDSSGKLPFFKTDGSSSNIPIL